MYIDAIYIQIFENGKLFFVFFSGENKDLFRGDKSSLHMFVK